MQAAVLGRDLVRIVSTLNNAVRHLSEDARSALEHAKGGARSAFEGAKADVQAVGESSPSSPSGAPLWAAIAVGGAASAALIVAFVPKVRNALLQFNDGALQRASDRVQAWLSADPVNDDAPPSGERESGSDEAEATPGIDRAQMSRDRAHDERREARNEARRQARAARRAPHAAAR